MFSMFFLSFFPFIFLIVKKLNYLCFIIFSFTYTPKRKNKHWLRQRYNLVVVCCVFPPSSINWQCFFQKFYEFVIKPEMNGCDLTGNFK